MEVLEMVSGTNRITLRLPNSVIAELKKDADDRGPASKFVDS